MSSVWAQSKHFSFLSHFNILQRCRQGMLASRNNKLRKCSVCCQHRRKSEFAASQWARHASICSECDVENTVQLPPSASKDSQECLLSKIDKGSSQQKRHLIRLPPSATKASREFLLGAIGKGSVLHKCNLCNIVFGTAQALGGHRTNSVEHAEKLAKLSKEEMTSYLAEGAHSKLLARRLPPTSSLSYSCPEKQKTSTTGAEHRKALEEDAASSDAGIRLPPSATRASREHLVEKLNKGSALHKCYVCNIVFANAQALGGHRTNSVEHAEKLAKAAKLSDEEMPSYMAEAEDAQASPRMLSLGAGASASCTSKRLRGAALPPSSWSHKKQKTWTGAGTERERALEEDATKALPPPGSSTTVRFGEGSGEVDEEDGPSVKRQGDGEHTPRMKTEGGGTQGKRGYRGPQGAVCQCGREEGVTLTSKGKPVRGCFSQGVFRCDRCYKRWKRAGLKQNHDKSDS